ncbi:MAG: hypothetical protein K5930_10940 [Treponemataceae bacterium]|nr:hypothetical protein [Treponemataceae bacterium]
MRKYLYKDSRSVIGSSIVTGFLWIMMTVGAYFIKPVSIQDEPEYVEISITLSDFPMQEMGEPEIENIQPEIMTPPEDKLSDSSLSESAQIQREDYSPAASVPEFEAETLPLPEPEAKVVETRPVQTQPAQTQTVKPQTVQPSTAEVIKPAEPPAPTTSSSAPLPSAASPVQPVSPVVKPVETRPVQTQPVQTQAVKPQTVQPSTAEVTKPAVQPVPSTSSAVATPSVTAPIQTPAPVTQPVPTPAPVAKPVTAPETVTSTVTEVPAAEKIEKPVLAPLPEQAVAASPEKTEPAEVLPLAPTPAAPEAAVKQVSTAPATQPIQTPVKEPQLVQPTTNTPEVETATPSAAASVPTPAPVTQPLPAPVTTRDDTVPVQNPSPAPVTAPVQTKPQQPTEEEMWAMLMGEDFAGLSSSNQTSSRVQNPVSATSSGISGSSSKTGGTNSNQNSQSYQAGGKKADNSSENSALSDRLGALTESASSGGARGASSASQAEKKEPEPEADGINSDISWTEGKSRKLIKPEVPDIKLSEESKQKIESNLRLNISFTVSEAGNIPIESIKISPPLQWPDVVTDIQQYISRNWRFETSDTKGLVTFRFTIKVK